jgi:hypothetical protein
MVGRGWFVVLKLWRVGEGAVEGGGVGQGGRPHGGGLEIVCYYTVYLSASDSGIESVYLSEDRIVKWSKRCVEGRGRFIGIPFRDWPERKRVFSRMEVSVPPVSVLVRRWTFGHQAA